jgi:hypothetical protein
MLLRERSVDHGLQNRQGGRSNIDSQGFGNRRETEWSLLLSTVSVVLDEMCQELMKDFLQNMMTSKMRWTDCLLQE